MPDSSSQPDYNKLVRFLVEPFLESPEALSVDCEVSQSQPRVLIRLAFEGSDKGRVFGRGGRNIQAIRALIAAFAQANGFSAHLDVYGGVPHPHEMEGNGSARRSERRPSGPPKPGPRRRPSS